MELKINKRKENKRKENIVHYKHCEFQLSEKHFSYNAKIACQVVKPKMKRKARC